ncbi:hypothetical protein I3843_16G058400 [Carya illinoinensis]|nr:hypothetical protein I3843_16G058400 [Carya illinoinensis]
MEGTLTSLIMNLRVATILMSAKIFRNPAMLLQHAPTLMEITHVLVPRDTKVMGG